MNVHFTCTTTVVSGNSAKTVGSEECPHRSQSFLRLLVRLGRESRNDSCTQSEPPENLGGRAEGATWDTRAGVGRCEACGDSETWESPPPSGAAAEESTETQGRVKRAPHGNRRQAVLPPWWFQESAPREQTSGRPSPLVIPREHPTGTDVRPSFPPDDSRRAPHGNKRQAVLPPWWFQPWLLSIPAVERMVKTHT